MTTNLSHLSVTGPYFDARERAWLVVEWNASIVTHHRFHTEEKAREFYMDLLVDLLEYDPSLATQ